MSILKIGMYASQFPTEQNYLTFSSDAPFSIKFNQKSWDGVLEYSLDAQNWYEWDASEISSVNNVIYLRGLGNSVITGENNAAYAMTITSPTNSDISCTGNIMTLLDHVSPGTAVMAVGCFTQMFRDSTNLTRAEIEFPAMNLAVNCYRTMFYNCASLTEAPELPATTLAGNCYAYMFQGCTSLTEAPELPATTLATYCYQNMFSGCTGIKISSTQTGIYQKAWRIPTTGTISNNPTVWSTDMLTNTSGTFKGDPDINTTYYQAG